MSTSSSDNERHGPEHNSAASAAQQSPSRSPPLPISVMTNDVPPLPPQIASKKAVATPSKAEDVIELSSSDDSMYILRSDARPAGGGAAVTSTRPIVAQISSKVKQPRRSTTREGSRASSRKSQKFTGEADEASTDHDSECESCAESEQNAQDLYHEAIMVSQWECEEQTTLDPNCAALRSIAQCAPSSQGSCNTLRRKRRSITNQ